MDRLDEILKLYETQIDQHVMGWFYRHDVAIIYTLMAYQMEHSIRGGVCELGTCMGKSAILLSRMRQPEENLYLVDLFLETNPMAEMMKNISTYGSAERVQCFQGDTLTMNVPNLGIEKALRFLHIDANHQHPYLLKDLYNFSPLVQPIGLICLDDINDPEYPGVHSAMTEFCLSSIGSKWRPFAIGQNKAYLCQREYLQAYRNFLLNCGTFSGISSATILDVEVMLLYTRNAVPLDELRARLQAA